MTENEDFFTTPEDEGVIQILPPEQIEEVVQELTELRGSSNNEFDSVSIDNAIRLCEKIDICFENLSDYEKEIILQNYDFYSTSQQFTLFLQLMFHGDLEAKEKTFRALSKKLKATFDVVQCVLSTKILFDSIEIEEEVKTKLTSLTDVILVSFSNLIPPSIREKGNNALSINWLQSVLAQHQPIFNVDEISYEKTTLLFSDLIFTIFSHKQLPFYFIWKDNYLKHWFVNLLREEDRYDNAPIPVLSAAKADLYAEYMSWTKISKRLNANLRHRQSFGSDSTIQAEKMMLERLPSNILLEMVMKLRQKMRKEEKVPEVDLGVDDDLMDDMALFNEMVEEIIDGEEKNETSSWFGALITKLKNNFTAKTGKPKEATKLIERPFSEGLLPTFSSDSLKFGEHFPQDYSGNIPKQFSLFFTRSRTNYLEVFEESLLEILMVYESDDASCIQNTPLTVTFTKSNHSLEFEEHCLVVHIGTNLMMLGNTHFQTALQEHLHHHPSPYGYFKWYNKTNEPGNRPGIFNANGQYYQEVPLNEIGANKEFFEGFQRVICSLPDSSYEKPYVQQLLSFLNH